VANTTAQDLGPLHDFLLLKMVLSCKRKEIHDVLEIRCSG